MGASPRPSPPVTSTVLWDVTLPVVTIIAWSVGACCICHQWLIVAFDFFFFRVDYYFPPFPLGQFLALHTPLPTPLPLPSPSPPPPHCVGLCCSAMRKSIANTPPPLLILLPLPPSPLPHLLYFHANTKVFKVEFDW